MEQTKYDVFISYSRKDYVDEDKNVISGNIISKIKKCFDKENISYWFDEEGVFSGDEFAGVLTRAIRDSRIFLFVSSVNSNQSKWTSNEISTALEYKKTIIPLRIDASPYNDSVMMKIVSLDYIECKDTEKAINKLIRAVKHHLYAYPLADKYLWRNVEVPEQARGSIVSFVVNGKWQEHVFVYDEVSGKFKKINTPENASVYKFIYDKKKLSELQCWQLLHDVAEGLFFLHSQEKPIAHQEITPGSILVNDDSHYTITDYDISSMSDIATVSHSRHRPDNNPAYMAPECFNRQYRPILASDIWSLGAVMFHLITGTPPFGNHGGVLQKNGYEIPIIEENYSQELKDLIYSMLTKEPWERPTAKMIEEYAYNKLNGIETDVLSAYNKLNRIEQDCQVNATNVQFGCALNDVRNITSAHSNNTVSSREKEGFFHSSLKKIKGLFLSKEKKTYNSFVPSSISEGDCVLSSIIAPVEIRRKSHLIVQVYLHLLEETEKVISLAQEVQKGAERRDYIPLQCKLSVGDKVEVLLNIYGETLLFSEKKRVVWRGSFTKCSFNYFVPTNIELDELSCMALLTVNEVPVGEMRFITKIVNAPRKLNTEIIAHKYSKVFISYSHQDESKVKFLHEGLELGSVPHFFDREYLRAGDVFPQVIQDYINSADLFILCWSENASKSDYVQKERLQALERAFPQVQPEQAAKLRIYPMSIEPRAELPSDMKENYHFGEI